MRHGNVARYAGVGWHGVNENPRRESAGPPAPIDGGHGRDDGEHVDGSPRWDGHGEPSGAHEDPRRPHDRPSSRHDDPNSGHDDPGSTHEDARSTREDPNAGRPGDSGLSRLGDPHDPAPAPPGFGIVLHLLAATALAFGSLVWGALILFGAVERTWLRASFSLVGLVIAIAWIVWLVRVTVDRDVWDDELPHPDSLRGDDDEPIA